MKNITILYSDELTFDEVITAIREACDYGLGENETMHFTDGYKVTRKCIGGHSSYRVVKTSKQV